MICCTRIKEAYDIFHSPVLNFPSPNQRVIGKYLLRFSTFDPSKCSCNKNFLTVTSYQLYNFLHLLLRYMSEYDFMSQMVSMIIHTYLSLL